MQHLLHLSCYQITNSWNRYRANNKENNYNIKQKQQQMITIQSTGKQPSYVKVEFALGTVQIALKNLQDAINLKKNNINAQETARIYLDALGIHLHLLTKNNQRARYEKYVQDFDFLKKESGKK